MAVTGGSGQLGTVLLRRLLRDPAVTEVVSIDVRPPRVPGSKLRSVEADVRAPDFAAHLRGCDALLHLAFVVTEHRPRAEVESINMGGTRNVLLAAVQAGVQRVVYASSIAAYGVVPGHPVPIVENCPRVYQPDFAYAACKFQVESFLDDFEQQHPALSVARLRPGILIGRYMEHPLGQALRRRVLPLVHDVPEPMVWDEDVADAFLLALSQGARGAFNLCADEPRRPTELCQDLGLSALRLTPRVALRLARLSPWLARVGIGQATDPAWLQHAGVLMVADCTRAKRELGWRPRHPTVTAVLRHFVETVPHKLDYRLRLFLRATQRLGWTQELSGVRARVHLCITGPQGGDVGVTVEDGALQVSAAPPRPPTAAVTLPAELLLELLKGRGDLGSAALTGKVQVEGDGSARQILRGMVSGFRNHGAEAGLLGRATLRLLQ